MGLAAVSRRQVLQAGVMLAGTGWLQACSSSQKAPLKVVGTTKKTVSSAAADQQSMRIFGSSGFAESHARSQLALQRLTDAGFQIANQEACFRRYQRFAGTDAERAGDLQDVAMGRVPTPKVLLAQRGGYGAIRILPAINWGNLGSRMRERGTMLFGYSDVTAIQLALLARGNMCSFAGPMLYSDFGSEQPSRFMLQSFVDNSCNADILVEVEEFQNQLVKAEGVFWGGNLSTLASLAGSDYMPKINGGILFIEDVGEQPYRLERMLQTLYLNGILSRQQAIVMGNFRMGSIHDVYDSSYTLNSVIQTVSRLARVPVLTGFPFGHIASKITFPLGAVARLQSTVAGGYQIRFGDYPVLEAKALSLNNLLPQPAVDMPDIFFNSFTGSQGTSPDKSNADRSDDME